jgi:GT2 family glycosyltransferase
VAFVNPDAIVAAPALAALAGALDDERAGIAMARLRLLAEPDLLNSGGGVVHFLGLGWAGDFRAPVGTVATRHDVTVASGAAMAMPSQLFWQLGGFSEPLFLYHEDLDLSLRVWLRGRRVQVVPEADVWHGYEFARNLDKFYYLERNRLIVVYTFYEPRTLVLLSPALVLFELGMLVMAWRQGWLAQKTRGWKWLVQNRNWVRRHRREVQRSRVIEDHELAKLLVGHFDAGQVSLPEALKPLDWLLARYWNFVVAVLGRR